MTTLQWVGLILGLLVIAIRLPGILWPRPYMDKALGIIEAGPTTLRVLGAVLWGFAVVIVALLAKTLSVLQIVLLVMAVLFVLGGGMIVLTPEVYQRFARRIAEGMPDPVIRLVCLVAVVFGSWLVYLSVTIS